MHENDYRPGASDAADAERLIVISGCSGGGKSALLAELARRGHASFPEPGRQIVREQTLIGGNAVPWQDMDAFLTLCVSRAMHFHTLALAAEGQVFFDRSLVDAVAAFETPEKAPPAAFTRALRTCRYARTVFLTPPWRELFIRDGERRHEFADATNEYERLTRAYPRHGYEIEIVPKGSVGERADFVEYKLKRRRQMPTALR